MALLLPPARDCCFSFPEILWQHLLPSGNTDKEASIDKKPNSSAAVSCLMTGLAGGTCGTCGAQDEHNTAPRSFSPSAPPPSVLSTLPLIEALDINIVEKYQQLYFVVKNIVHLQIERGYFLKFSTHFHIVRLWSWTDVSDWEALLLNEKVSSAKAGKGNVRGWVELSVRGRVSIIQGGRENIIWGGRSEEKRWWLSKMGKSPPTSLSGWSQILRLVK